MAVGTNEQVVTTAASVRTARQKPPVWLLQRNGCSIAGSDAVAEANEGEVLNASAKSRWHEYEETKCNILWNFGPETKSLWEVDAPSFRAKELKQQG